VVTWFLVVDSTKVATGVEGSGVDMGPCIALGARQPYPSLP
jgi:hypothetical protein